MSIGPLLTSFLNYAGGYFSTVDLSEIREIILVLISITVHVLDARQRIFSRILIFPNLLLNICVYSARGLYGKVLYSVVSVLLNVYAYLRWKGGKTHPPVQVSRTTTKMLLSIMGLGLFGALVWSFMMSNRAHIAISAIYLDAAYTSFGFVEKWLMSHKKLERWVLAFFRYLAFSIACYNTGSKILMIQHIVLAGVAIYGQLKWYRAYKHA